MIDIEELLSCFERRPSWAWIVGKYLPSPVACPRCKKKLIGKKAKESFLTPRRTYCQSCGKRFSPAEGTPLHGTRWRPEEVVRLAYLFAGGQPVARIGTILGKSPAAVRDMLDRFKLREDLSQEGN